MSEKNNDTNKLEKDISSWSHSSEHNTKMHDNKFKGVTQSHYVEESPEKIFRQHKSRSKESEKQNSDKGLKVFLMSSIAIIGAVALICGTLAFAPFLSQNANLDFSNQSNTSQDSTPIFITNDIPEEEGAKRAEEIYQKTAPSIVGVATYNPAAGLISSATGQGSGIIMAEDGYIVTNAHVIGNSNKYNVTVFTSDKKEYAAKVVGFDTRTDLAVLKIEATGLTAAEFGNSDKLAVGATVLAIGNPGGLEFSNSLTRGVVSALNRTVKATNSTVNFIQTDAAINPGNSGGALVNVYGQVIGINTAKVSEFEGMSFSIPSNTAKAVVDDILSKGYVSGRAKIGITVRTLSAREVRDNDVPQGLLVIEINNANNSGTNGLKIGDIITKFNGADIRTTSDLYAELVKCSPNTTAKLTVYRLSPIRSEESSTIDIEVTLVEDKGETQ